MKIASFPCLMGIAVVISGVGSCLAAGEESFPEGFNFGTTATIKPYTQGYVDLGYDDGGWQIWSGTLGNPGADPKVGGITMFGNPLTFFLGAVNESEPEDSLDGLFQVRDVGSYAMAVPSLFEIDSHAATSTFHGLEVRVNDGGLLVEGHPVLSTATAPQWLGSQGYLQQQDLTASLLTAEPPLSSSAWTDAFLPRGDVGSGGVFAFGNGSKAPGLFAMAMGPNAQAGGYASVARGPSALASGSYSRAVGALTTTASGSYSDARGFGVMASGMMTTAVGVLSEASGSHATAVGFYSEASGIYSYARGRNVEASGQYSEAVGHQTTAFGDYSRAFGQHAESGGRHASASGYDVKSSGNQSMAYGAYLRANSAHEIVLGYHNERTLNASPITPVLTEALFRVGNGFWDLDFPQIDGPSDAITTLKNGRTRLKNVFWDEQSPLELPEGALPASGGEALVVEGHTLLRGRVVIEAAQGDISMGVYGPDAGGQAGD